VADLEAVASMAEVGSEVVVSTAVEGLAGTTEATVVLAGPTADSGGRVEWDADLSGVRADIPAWGVGSRVEEPGPAIASHPARESLTANGTVSVALLAERALGPAALRLSVVGVVASADGAEAGVIPAGDGVGAVGD
jgi:hypothetical protein